MEGKAYSLDGGVEFVVEDPNGAVMKGYYYPTGEDVYMLQFTESEWDSVEADMEIADFVPVID